MRANPGVQITAYKNITPIIDVRARLLQGTADFLARKKVNSMIIHLKIGIKNSTPRWQKFEIVHVKT